ncbi:MDR family MFS transporter [Gordonibacter sp. 28C]|uniref:MDR family MFS transporter n=1 Tax=Gordonibacter sp. 28C TaxID=2078569 RepID=UPI001314A36D|nr:MDR family MFS transporter [Gordonibacter sp. 28C]
MDQANADTDKIPRRAVAIVAVMMVGSFISILNQNLMTTAIPTFMGVFSVESSAAQWLTTAFMLANGIMVPVTAYLIRRFSTRALFFAALGLFAAGTVLCASARFFEMLLAGRIVQALGAGITMPLMQTVLFTLFPAGKRGTAMGFFGLVVAFAPAMGPTISGWIVDSFPWQALFLLLLPIIAADLLVAFFVVRNVGERSNPCLDVPSVVLSSLGFGGLLYGLSMVGTLGWGSPVLVGTLAVAAASLAWFVARQLHLEEPMLEVRVFKFRTFTVSMVLVVVAWSSFMGAATMLPMFMQNMAGFSALDSGMTLMAGGIVMGVLSPLNGRVFDRFGARVLAPVGLFLVMAGTFLLAHAETGSGMLYIGASYAVLMAGQSMVSMPLTTSALNSLPIALIPHGTAMNNTMRSIMGALGTAVFVTIMTGVSASAVQAGVEGGASLGFDAAFWTMVALNAAAFVASLFVLRSPKDAGKDDAAEAAAAATGPR